MLGQINRIIFQKNDGYYRGSAEHLVPGVYLLRIQDGPVVHQVKFIKKMKTSVISSSQFRIAVAVSISVMMITFLVQLSSCHKCCAPAFNPREAVKAKLMANNWKMQTCPSLMMSTRQTLMSGLQFSLLRLLSLTYKRKGSMDGQWVRGLLYRRMDGRSGAMMGLMLQWK